MANFAKLNNDNEVIEKVYLLTKENVNPVTGVEDESFGIKYLTDNHGHLNWKQFSIHTSKGVHLRGRTPLRKNCPGIGWKYDSEKDAFIPPDSLKPYPSWVWDDSICWWKSPVDEPTDGITDEEAAGQKDENGVYTVLPYYWIWDESSTNWKKTNEKA